MQASSLLEPRDEPFFRRLVGDPLRRLVTVLQRTSAGMTIAFGKSTELFATHIVGSPE